MVVAVTAVIVGVLTPGPAVNTAARLSPEVLYRVPVENRVVALTIDDGPSPRTADILDVLDANDASATFFLIGENMPNAGPSVRAIIGRGSEIGNHTMVDAPSIRLSPDELRDQIQATEQLLGDLPSSRLFRPGSGWYDGAMLRTVREAGYRLVLGSVYPFDAQIPSVGFASWYILHNVEPGSIIVLHDGADRGRRTAATLRRVLPELRRRGYTITTVTKLLEHAGSPDRAGPDRAHLAGRDSPRM